MSSPFQKAFSAKSPLHNHGDKFLQKAKKLSEKGGQGQGGYDYENDKVMKLKAKGEEKNASHSNPKEQTNLPSTADEYQSVVNMNYEADDSALKNKPKLNSKERKMVRQEVNGGDVIPRNPFTEVNPEKVKAEILKKKKKKLKA